MSPGHPSFYNIGTGKPQSLREFAEFWWEYWAANGELKFGEVSHRNNEVMRYVPEISNDFWMNTVISD
jgi:hypothetical protein